MRGYPPPILCWSMFWTPSKPSKYTNLLRLQEQWSQLQEGLWTASKWKTCLLGGGVTVQWIAAKTCVRKSNPPANGRLRMTNFSFKCTIAVLFPLCDEGQEFTCGLLPILSPTKPPRLIMNAAPLSASALFHLTRPTQWYLQVPMAVRRALALR